MVRIESDRIKGPGALQRSWQACFGGTEWQTRVPHSLSLLCEDHPHPVYISNVLASGTSIVVATVQPQQPARTLCSGDTRYVSRASSRAVRKNRRRRLTREA